MVVFFILWLPWLKYGNCDIYGSGEYNASNDNDKTTLGDDDNGNNLTQGNNDNKNEGDNDTYNYVLYIL